VDEKGEDAMKNHAGDKDSRQEGSVAFGGSGASRRAFLKSAAVVGAGALLPTGRWMMPQAPSRAPQNGRIDVHYHFAPPELKLAGMQNWTLAKALEDLDAGGVATGITSMAPAGDPFRDPTTAVRVARQCNDFAARMVQDHPGRFGMYGNMPMPNIDATLKEIEYTMDTLKADGICFFTSYRDKWLGDAAFNPVFEELNRRKAVVYTHPESADCCRNLMPTVGDGAIEWGTDTTRAIALMIFGGAQARYPDVRMIWSHGGGTMPFLIERFVNMAKSTQNAPKFPQGFVGAASKYYYDTAQVANSAAMSALSKVVPMSQIVFGSDYPFRTPLEHVTGLKNCGVFSAQDLKLIDRENAQPLFPRFKA
jgi:6-methylsalicylate decarboxylase